ncbi:MAG: TonB-dependent receptor [Fusobacterium gastrosuis]|uniref:TonB-dependent receptor family protein n=1 Tax=Fusobacterium TaxID=848 RepID=UPI0025BC959A|nr:TonB-dependent receptor [Fusobacterium sp.]MCI7223554.1 TonB-dependent receptor [Fusobacterium sp.]MDD7392020.1 TonB-dependent receptor [Fusobacteriaceae bacterium]MDY5795582.1 TonB-dependent receptor [Fusobacterium gastrosuis]
MKKKLMALSFIVCCAAYGETIGEVRLKETVITGTGFEANQNSQIKNITVIKKEDIENKGYNSVEEVLKNAPGLSFVHNGFGMVADIRGQGREEATKRVKVLVDGVPINILDLSHGLVPINTMSVDNIEKIEIINGGGAVLYGSGTAGGVINIITKNNQKDKVDGKVYYQNSSFDTNKVGFNTGLKLTDNLQVDLAYEHQNGDGYRDRDEKKSNDFRGGLTYNINENQTLKFKASKFKQDYFEVDSLTAEEVKVDRRQVGQKLTDGKVDREEYSLAYDIKATENLKFNLLGYKQETEREYDQVQKMAITDGLFKDEKKGLNLRGNYNYSLGHLIFGYEYLNADATRNAINNYTITTPRGVMKMGSETFINLGKNTHSLFVLNRHLLTNKLESTLGYRYEHSEYDIDRKAFSVMSGRKSPAGVINSDKTAKNHAYEIGLNYKYSDTGNVYAKYERGFRSPSPTELVDKIAGIYTLNNVNSETYDTVEVGLKDMLGKSYVSATVFFTKTENEIYTKFTAGHSSNWNVVNIPETQRKGFELFAEQYFNKFRINESLTYVDAQITKGKDVGKYKGKEIPYVSKVKATLGATYDFTTELSANANVNYFSSARDTGNNKIKGYTTVDIGANYQHENGLGVQAGIKNLFGEKYYNYANIAENAYAPAPERTYYIGASYKF